MIEVSNREFGEYRDKILDKYDYPRLSYEYQKNDDSILCFLDGICISKYMMKKDIWMINDILEGK